jgi:hypothetical protein
MAGKAYTIINGNDLASFMKKYNPDFAPKIDPHGLNVVYFSMIHNDDSIRAAMLIKTIGETKPTEATIDFPLSVWGKITHKIWDEGANAPSN